MPSSSSAARSRRVVRAEDLDVVSLSSQSDASSESEGEEETGSELSDALDSEGPRKKRKVSLDVEVEPVDDEPYTTPVVSSIQVPSRIKRKSTSTATAVKLDVEPQTTPGAVPVDPNTTFESLNLRPMLVSSLANMAIKRPTGIQKFCIPEVRHFIVIWSCRMCADT
jgi:ATP-dependent RNA helicase DDX49/DBP8